jgi:transposase
MTDLSPIVKRCAGLDIHRSIIVGTILCENPDGTVKEETREFGVFRKHRRQLTKWLQSNAIDMTVMESTGIYHKCIYKDLEKAGLPVQLVNARYVKQVPGRKTDVKDSQWLASLARFGLLKSSFVPPVDLGEIRLITRYRLKQQSILAGEKNRLHKVLDDSGIRLGTVVSDINGVSARQMIAGLIEGKPLKELVQLAKGKLKAKSHELRESLEGELSVQHRFLLKQIQAHIDYLEKEVAELDQHLADAMKSYQGPIELLQTIPGIQQTSARTLVAEIGVDMSQFGSAEKLASWAGMCPGNNESAGKKKAVRDEREIPLFKEPCVRLPMPPE